MLALLTALLLAPPASVADVVRATLDAHPALDAIEARVAALQAGERRARVRPDPRLGVQYSNMPLTGPWPGRHPMSGVQLSLSQTLVGSAKIDARVAVAEARTRVDRATLADARNRLGAAAAEAWHQLALARALAGLTVDHRATVEQLRAVLRVRYATNGAAQHALVQLDLLDAQLGETKADLDARALAIQARLNAAMGQRPAAPIETPARHVVPDAPPLSTLLAQIGGHPRLAVLTAQDALARAGVTRADAERAPDLTVSAQYRLRSAVDPGDSGEDFIGVGASMPLPWLWNDARWGAEADGHRATARAVARQAEALARTFKADVAAAHAALTRSRARLAALEAKLIPTASAALDSALAAYRVGRASFDALYRAQRALLDLEQAVRRARTDAALAAVRIDAALGRFGRVDE